MAGRKKGQKNLSHTGGRTTNQYGVSFTENEKKKLESLVNSVNRKRKNILTNPKMLDTRTALGVDPDFIFGVHSEKNLWGTGADTLLTKNRSKSLQRFKTKDEFRQYMKDLKRLSDKAYVDKRMKLYRKNKIKAMKNVFGSDVKDIVKGLNKLTDKEYKEILANHSLPSISFMYTEEEYDKALEKIKTNYGELDKKYNLSKRTKKKTTKKKKRK